MNELSFLRTLTVAQFKSEQNCSKIDAKENPKNPGHFFMCNEAGSVIGAVSAKITTGLDKPVVSEVSDGSRTFFLLHNKGEGGAATIASF